MAVKVTLKSRGVEEFDDENAQFFERSDGFLEVSQGDEILKIFSKGWWVAVEGKRKPDDLFHGLA
jgi:hypothetical protein